MKPQREKSNGGTSGDIVGKVMEVSLPFHRCENCSFGYARTSSPQWGGAPLCWNTTFGFRSSKCGTTFSVNKSRYTFAEMLCSVKKKLPMIWLHVIPYHTIPFELLLLKSRASWRKSDPQIDMLCQVNFPETWNLGSSLKEIFSRKKICLFSNRVSTDTDKCSFFVW